MGYELLVVESAKNLEPVPQVAADDYATKTQFLGNVDVVEVHAPHGVDLLVDEPLLGGYFQFVHCKVGLVAGIALAVEERLQKDVVRAFLRILQLTDCVACAADIAAIA